MGLVVDTFDVRLPTFFSADLTTTAHTRQVSSHLHPPEPYSKWRDYEECSGCACEALQVVKSILAFTRFQIFSSIISRAPALSTWWRRIDSKLSSLYVCIVNIIYMFSFAETPRKIIIVQLSIRKLGSSSVLIIHYYYGSKALQ